MDRVFFHIDMDAFFASVEQLDNPQLRGQPVIVGSSEPRGVVSTCSYEARVFGVRSAMPSFEAKKRCPEAIFVHGRMERYKEISGRVMEILTCFSPEVNIVSIDEAYLDMTGTELLFGSPSESAEKLKKAIFDKIGLTASVGIAQNRMMAKLASEYKKPNGLYEIKKGEEIAFLDSIKLKDIWGIGKKTLERFNNLGITEIKQLRFYSKKILSGMFGENSAEYIYKVVRGEDPGVWNSSPKSRSISNELTFEKDIQCEIILKKYLLALSRQLMFRLLDSEYVSQTVFLKIKYFDFSVFTAQTTIATPVKCSDDIYTLLIKLLDEKLNRLKPVRLIGAGLSSLEDKTKAYQLDLFSKSSDKKSDVEKAINNLSKKIPNVKIFKADLMNIEGKN